MAMAIYGKTAISKVNEFCLCKLYSVIHTYSTLHNHSINKLFGEYLEQYSLFIHVYAAQVMECTLINFNVLLYIRFRYFVVSHHGNNNGLNRTKKK